MWRQPVSTELRTNVLVLTPGNFDAGSDDNTTEGAPAAVGMRIPPGNRAHVKKHSHPTPALDPQSSLDLFHRIEQRVRPRLVLLGDRVPAELQDTSNMPP
jgi:hypothetical protein